VDHHDGPFRLDPEVLVGSVLSDAMKHFGPRGTSRRGRFFCGTGEVREDAASPADAMELSEIINSEETP